MSDGIASPTPYVTATVQVAAAVDPQAVVGDPITTTVGQTVQFTGSGSTPARRYLQLPVGLRRRRDRQSSRSHPCLQSTGNDTATLTVTGFGGHTSQATEAVDVLATPSHGLTISVTDAASHDPLDSATVIVENSENTISNAVSEGGGSYEIDGLGDGSYTAYAYQSGYLPATATTTVTNGTGTASVALTSGSVATSDLTTTQLTATQAEALGIDTSAPGNQFV